MSGVDVSRMYKQKVELGETIYYMLTFNVPKEGHYSLQIISPLSTAEKMIKY